MEIKKDNELYEAMHEKVMRVMLGYIYSALKESGHIPEEELEGLVENIAFNIGAVIDGSAVMKTEGHDVLPYLAFSESQENRQNLIISDTGSYFHELVYGVMDDIEFEEDVDGDYLVAELEIIYGKGRKDEMSILKSHLENKEHLMLDLEVSLYIRDINELNKKIDVVKVLSKKLEKKSGIKYLRFKSAKDLENDNWLLIPLKENDFGSFDESVEGIFNCIHSVTKKWV